MVGTNGARPMRIDFLIAALEQGGAERQLVVLAKGLHARGHRVRVLTFYPGGFYAPELDAAGVPHIALGKRSRWDLLGPSLRLRQILTEGRTELVHGYLASANLIALGSRWLGSGARVVWGVRASSRDLSRYSRVARGSSWVEEKLARQADLIIANSEAGRAAAIARGFQPDPFEVVPNGIDTARFSPSPERGKALRDAWGIKAGEVVFGLVGRVDPVKGHEVFLEASQRLASRDASARFVCVGRASRGDLERLQSLPTSRELGAKLSWIDGQSDMPPVYGAMDGLVSASHSEGFSNVVGEAMACGLPCVVTDVGDSARLVGDSGFVAPPRDPEALAQAMERLVAADRIALGVAARTRIQEHFSVDALVNRTESLLRACLAASTS